MPRKRGIKRPRAASGHGEGAARSAQRAVPTLAPAAPTLARSSSMTSFRIWAASN